MNSSSSSSSSVGSSSKEKKMAARANNPDEMPLTFPSFPEELIESFISFLSIKDAFTSSYISKRYKDSWKLSRDLTFDVNFFRRPNSFNILRRVMDEHSGPVIEKMNFILDPIGNQDRILDWIKKAIAKGLKDLHLNFSSGQLPFVLPPDIFDGSNLHGLTIRNCEIPLLNKFDGFRCLKKIVLGNIPIFRREFSNAIFENCLLLESFEITRCKSEEEAFRIRGRHLKNFKILKIEYFNDLLHMLIDVPSLQVFHYVGSTCSFNIRPEMNQIAEVLLHLDATIIYNSFHSVEMLMASLKLMRRLSLSNKILERFCLELIYHHLEEYHLNFVNIREICLCLGGQRINEPHATVLSPYEIAFFLSKCPHLEKLTIDFGWYALESTTLYWQRLLKGFLASFQFLNSAHFLNFRFRDPEMKLAMFIVSNAKSIEDCVIVKARNYQGIKEEDEPNFLGWLSTQSPRVMVYQHDQYEEPVWSMATN